MQDLLPVSLSLVYRSSYQRGSLSFIIIIISQSCSISWIKIVVYEVLFISELVAPGAIVQGSVVIR